MAQSAGWMRRQIDPTVEILTRTRMQGRLVGLLAVDALNDIDFSLYGDH